MQKINTIRIFYKQKQVNLLLYVLIVLFFAFSCKTTPKLNLNHFLVPATKHEAELQILLETSFSHEDRILLYTIENIFQNFEDLYDKKFEKVKESSKIILYTPGLTPAIYKISLAAFSLAKISIVDESYSSILKKHIKPDNYDFDRFQEDECQELCNSIGWTILAQNDPNLFRPYEFGKKILNKDILKLFRIKLENLIQENIIYDSDMDQNTNLESNQYNNYPSKSAEYLLGNNRENFGLDHKFSFDNSLNSELILSKDRALNYFKTGQFQDSIKIFLSISEGTKNLEIKSMCYYWLGRNYNALSDYSNASKYFFLSGSSNPLSLYDSLSGQILKIQSGRSSTQLLSPFSNSWKLEINKWHEYPNENNFSTNYIKGNFDLNLEFIRKTIKSTFLVIASKKFENNIHGHINLQDYFLNQKTSRIQEDKKSVVNYMKILFLSDQIHWLNKSWLPHMNICCNSSLQNYISTSIAWLYYSTGEYLAATFFINNVKDFINLYDGRNNYLYFLFYPKPYKDEFLQAAQKNNIDVDILYAIYRQDSLFLIKPSKQNVINSAFRIRTLMGKYNNNLVYTLTAYYAGIPFTDELLKKNNSFKDDVLFIELIPNLQAKNLVVEALRNYYNIKWIYSEKKTEKWWQHMLFF